jgi:hypothetical protein
MINSDEIKTIREWEQMYPRLWLFIEVTREDIHDIYEGKLIATAEDPMELVEIGKLYDERHIVNLTTRGDVPELDDPNVAVVVG